MLGHFPVSCEATSLWVSVQLLLHCLETASAGRNHCLRGEAGSGCSETGS